MKKKITRTKGDRFCTLEVEIRSREDEGPELSICGTAGRIISRAKGKREALAYWTSYFEESPGEIYELAKRFDKTFRTPKGAARFVLECDGELHGLDVVGHEGGDKLMICDSCGQIREELEAFFPEVAPYFKWHLNNLNAGCEHQDALGWGSGKTIALDNGDLTEAQREALSELAVNRVKADREREERRRWEEWRATEASAAKAILAATGHKATIHDVETLLADRGRLPAPHVVTRVREWIREGVEIDLPVKPFEAEIFKDCIGAPCPTCGYRYGTAWLKRELPAEVVAWAEGLPETLKGAA